MQDLNRELHNIQLESTLLNVPQEIKERILHFLGSHYRIYLGYELDAWQTFLDDGIFVILKTIIDNGADLKALLFMKKNYFANPEVAVQQIIIHHAVNTQSVAVVKRICCLWPEVRFLDKGWWASERNEFLWGMKNLGSDEIRARSSWVYVSKLKDYTHIPKLLKSGHWPMSFIDNEKNVPRATVATWVREIFEEVYKFSKDHFHKKQIRDTIKFYNGERHDYLEKLRIHICDPEGLGLEYEYEYQFVAGGIRMYRLICEFAHKDTHFLDECIAIYNEATTFEVLKSNTFYLVSKMVVHGKEELLPVLAKIGGTEPILTQALKIKNAVDNKDVVALRKLFPNPDPDVYTRESRAEALNHFDLFFFIMFFYDFVDDLREHFAERNYGHRAFKVPVTLDPEILIGRILQDISMKDEHYTRSIYGLKHLGYDLNTRFSIDLAFDEYNDDLNIFDEEAYSPHNVLDRWQTYQSLGLKIQETISISALYERYRTDPSFHLSDTDHYLECYDDRPWEPNDHLLKLKWFLYRTLKEKIPLSDVKRGEDLHLPKSWTQKFENTVTNAIVCSRIAVGKSPTTGRVTVAWITRPFGHSTDFHSMSIIHAWEALIGKEVPNLTF